MTMNMNGTPGLVLAILLGIIALRLHLIDYAAALWFLAWHPLGMQNL